MGQTLGQTPGLNGDTFENHATADPAYPTIYKNSGYCYECLVPFRVPPASGPLNFPSNLLPSMVVSTV